MSRLRKGRKAVAASARWWDRARPVVAGVLTLLIAAGVVAAVAWLGGAARDRIGPRDRYDVRFADVDCTPPPGVDRDTFLTEVRFLARFPESYQLLAPDRDDRLRAAFQAHPWVEAVEGVDAEPPATVRVRLRYRTPALAVVLEDGGVRVVDAAGYLLPRSAPREGLPTLLTPVPVPVVEAGHEWPSDTVKRAVVLAAAYRPRTLERIWRRWRLTLPDGRAVLVGP